MCLVNLKEWENVNINSVTLASSCLVRNPSNALGGFLIEADAMIDRRYGCKQLFELETLVTWKLELEYIFKGVYGAGTIEISITKTSMIALCKGYDRIKLCCTLNSLLNW
ncbi:hypothetical protein RF11_04037 [Thelohanellus kitauei]|uniref:Uncharacterized protein n=1 Tax=Thelohanellus kitauei TaxID=669202 RepID=A0A0C2NBY9_THEKT|nr:hypothetical protein RF11_04037 [Thelohanellus kitauei]